MRANEAYSFNTNGNHRERRVNRPSGEAWVHGHSIMESLVSFLFKYRPFFFREGDFSFQWIPSWWQLLLLLALLSGFVLWLYHDRWRRHPGGAFWFLASLRWTFLLVLMLLLMRPSLVISSLVPRENLLALLVDDSSSMGIQHGRAPRGQPMIDLLAPESDFVKALEEKFFLRPYRFDVSSESATLPYTLSWSGDQTDISGGITRILNETRNLPLAGVVLFSDGADNSFNSFRDVMAELKSRQVPVYTVGLGPEEIENDIELEQVSTARELIPDSIATARVTLRHHGFGGTRGRLEVREGNSLVQSQEVYFSPGSQTITTELKISPRTEGTKTYQFRLQPLEGEHITQNNTRSAIVKVRDSRPRILYVEGHPRWEYKFIRRAVMPDKSLRLETLLRTAINKFYRQGIEEESTLATGFPSDREELFQYKGIIFGSVESSFFTYEQMEMVRDFVGNRGGGFLMLGGNSSYASGKYQNSPIETILPVQLQEAGTGEPYARGGGLFIPTDHGHRHPALTLPSATDNEGKKWKDMPTLSDWNLVSGLKPGTTVLARLGASTSGNENTPLLTFHRFGRGHSVSLLTGSSWRWQMGSDANDLGHETFWRQMLRWLVSSAKNQVNVQTERDNYVRNEVIRIRAEVNDDSFNRINDALVEASVTAPSGSTTVLPLRWSARQDGVYEGQWHAFEDGVYEVQVRATQTGDASDEDHGRAGASFLVRTASREYFDSAQKVDFLQRLARESGGRYYDLDTVANLPEEIVYTQHQSSVLEILDLWDMPFNFLLLLGLLGAEWIGRKKYGSI